MPELNDPPPDSALVEEAADDAAVGRAVWISLAVLLLAGVCAGAAYAVIVSMRPEAVDTVVDVPPPPVRDVSKIELPSVPFTLMTPDAGLSFEVNNGAAGEKLLPETMSGGVAAFDYDGDHDADILLVGSSDWPWTEDRSDAPSLALYRNDGEFRFTDVTAEAGLDITLYAMGPAVGDFDADGDLDLYITAVGANRLLRNDGGVFADVTEETGTAGGPDDWATSAAFLDYDRDGDLDLLSLNYVQWSREFDLAQDFRLTGGDRAYGRPLNFAGSQPQLFRNDGGTFTDVAEDAGLYVVNDDTGVAACKSLGVAVQDFDRDGWPDLFVANDTVRNCLFRNRRDGTFEEVGIFAGVAFDDTGSARGAMGVDTAWFRGDETMGIAIGNFANEMTALYAGESGELAFSDEATVSGLGPQTRLFLTFGVLWADVDLDGRPDLFCANGHLEEDITLVQPSQTYAQRPQLFWNAGTEGATEFSPMMAAQIGEAFLEPVVGRGAAAADFDRDGDQDLVIARLDGPPRLLRNDQSLGHHWLRVRVEPPAAAVGAEVTLRSGGTMQRQTVTPARSYLSQCELPLTFGLGTGDAVESLSVRWPDGKEQSVDVPGVDREIVVERAP